ncbi:hypothetical protein ACFXK0_15740, partial [Nocardia sp. NPDC059177]|uniref:hypothetical protein n=1 Tax=Nocardia sp. NPDC059177 TaxID=3346759 RepID=UPI00369EBC0B
GHSLLRLPHTGRRADRIQEAREGPINHMRHGLRIDVENPDPGGRPGQMHLQEQINGVKSSDAPKYQYNFDTGKFEGMPKSLQKELARTDYMKGAAKGLRFLSE